MRRGLPHNPTTEMDLALWDLAQRVRTDPTLHGHWPGARPDEVACEYARCQLPPTPSARPGRILARYGHRGVAEIDLGVPHWGDDPTHIIGMLANYLALDRHGSWRRMLSSAALPPRPTLW